MGTHYLTTKPRLSSTAFYGDGGWGGHDQWAISTVGIQSLAHPEEDIQQQELGPSLSNHIILGYMYIVVSLVQPDSCMGG